MLPLKLVRSLVFGETINNNPLLLPQNQHDEDPHHNNDDGYDADSNAKDGHHKPTEGRSKTSKSRTPFLLFLPTKELVADTYRLATIARDMGMDLHPTPSLSHIILSYPPPPSSSSSSPSSTSPSTYSWSSSSLSSTSLPDDTVPLPFPSLSTASISHLRAFVKLSKGLFKLVFVRSNCKATEATSESNWNCSSMSLFSRLTGDRIDTMEGFSRALAGLGWTLFKTKENPSADSGHRRVCGGKSVYLFRKVDTNRVRACSAGECRVRELRLPPLDFSNAPLRILQYILLMTDDIFYLA
ncbi:hypothetical protein ACE6H2_015755 [Prunus campanulata]